MTQRYVCVGAVILLLSLCLPVGAHAQKLVFVVRHAERADGGASQMQGQADPPLSPAGAARAATMARMLGEAGIKAIFVTEFRRTQDTAKPLARKLGLAAQQISSRDTDALISKLRSEHANDIVFVVGHSNTVPAIIKAFGGPDVTIADSEYDNLFVVVPGTGTVARIKITP